MDRNEFENSIKIDALARISVGKAIVSILALSAAALLLLVWILYLKPPRVDPGSWVYSLPGLNATLNSISAILILLGFLEIKKRDFRKHMKFMLGAFVASSLFLVSYLVYHNSVGHTSFPAEGWIRPVYFTLLISHIILSAFVVPLVLTSYYFAFSGRLETHRKVSKWTFPIWLYVSMTGVIIYFVLNAFV